MWKILLLNLTLAGLVISQSVTSELIQNRTSSKMEKSDEQAEEGSQENPFQPIKLADGGTLGDFKYYFIILVVTSISIIVIITIRALRLRKSRAELKYGKSNMTDKTEIEPLERSKWLEESSDEDENQIFDINFLKNSRSQNAT